MCPACLAALAMIVGGVVSTGGATALAVKAFGRNKENREASEREGGGGRAEVANLEKKEKQA